MNRRDLLKVLLGSAAATFVDYEKLLWVPGEKRIYLPSPTHTNLKAIIEYEMNRLRPHLLRLFERDNLFYTTMGTQDENRR